MPVESTRNWFCSAVAGVVSPWTQWSQMWYTRPVRPSAFLRGVVQVSRSAARLSPSRDSRVRGVPPHAGLTFRRGMSRHCMACGSTLALSVCLSSFLPTRLLLLYPKTKSKDAKDKEKPSRHQFVPGTFSGVLQCSVCDKTLLGKESSQCSSKSVGSVCAVPAFCLPRQSAPGE